jgi:hypothetical protein
MRIPSEADRRAEPSREPGVASSPLGAAGGSPVRPRRSRRSPRRRRRGATLVEFALVVPVLFLLIFGTFEFGRLMMVQQIMTNAAREGARRGILEQSTAPEVETIVADYLTESTVAPATVSVSPDNLSGVGFGEPVTVTVSVPFDEVSWLPTPWFLGGKNLSIECVMCAERPE